MLFLGYITVTNKRELNDLPFDHHASHSGERIQDVEASLAQAHIEGGHIEPVADQYCAIISPSHIGGCTPAPDSSLVDYVVVDQSGGMKHLHNRTHTDRRGRHISAHES